MIGEIWEVKKTHKLVLERENTQRDVKEQVAGGKRMGGWGGGEGQKGKLGVEKVQEANCELEIKRQSISEREWRVRQRFGERGNGIT